MWNLSSSSSILINSEKVNDPETVANAFNTFFLTVTKNLNLHHVGREYAFSFLKNAFPGRFPVIKIIPTNENEKQSVVYSIKPKKVIRLQLNNK
jgi:hypothetical protein